MKIESSRQTFIEQTNEQTDEQRLAFTGLLTEPKIYQRDTEIKDIRQYNIIFFILILF